MIKAKLAGQAKREKALLVAIARGKAEQGFVYDKDLAAAMGMKASTFCTYKGDNFQNMKLRNFIALARALHMTDREVCDCVGVPYSPGNVT